LRNTKKASGRTRGIRRSTLNASPRSTKLEPFRVWGSAETETRLFGDRPLSEWPLWIEPEADRSLKIDAIVTTLRERRRPPRLQSKEALERLKIKCPYFRVRKDLAYAVGYATTESRLFEALIRDSDGSADKLLAIKRTVAKLLGASAIKEEPGGLCGLLRQWVSGADISPFLHLEWNERSKVAKAADDFGAVMENLHRISELIDEKLSSRPTGQGAPDYWKINFVAMMGRSWRDLTGRNPSSSTSTPGSLVFTDFLVGGYNTLWTLCGVEDSDETEWESAILSANSIMKKANQSTE
jgi:hypothetical protein